MSEYNIVHAHIYDPANSIFKSNRNDKAECQVVKCSNSENCGLYKRGECATLSMLGARNCPYGKKTYEQGFTKKARGYGRWVSERREKYKEYSGKLATYKDKLAVVGDYVFVPYPHMNMNTALPVESHGFVFSNGTHFIHKDQFTIEVVRSIVNFRPQALFGGEISSYQKEVVPKFLTHLKKEIPEMFEQLLLAEPRVKDIIGSFSNVGRKALLHTLEPGTVVTKYHGSRDLNTQHWMWDGEYLISTDAGVSFPIVDFVECYIKLKPKPGVSVEIISEDQVDENTEYAN